MAIIKNVLELDKPCTGCGACFSVCPKGAITIKRDKEGFYSSFIDNEKCINCGLCTKVCVKAHIDECPSIEQSKNFSGRSKDKNVLLNSSSGGIAHELSTLAIDNGYKVAGVVYDSKNNKAIMEIAEKNEDLEAFSKSKYIQAYTAEAFKNIVDDIKNNNSKYLVFGTPCQIYGMKMLAKYYKIEDKLLLVDFYCHGVPSGLVWDLYLKENGFDVGEENKVTFRDKKYGWHDCYYMNIESSKKKYNKVNDADLFYTVFFDNVLFMDNCFTCDLRKGKSFADIRLGDFLGSKYLKDNNGVSAITVLSDAGQEFIDKANIEIIDQVELNGILKYQSTKDYPHKDLRDRSFEILLKENNLKKTVKYYRKEFPFKKRMKRKIKVSLSHILPKRLFSYLKRKM